MAYKPNTGLSPQQLCASILNSVGKLRTVTPGQLLTVGLDGGKEFSFVVHSNDGREMVVSVAQIRQPARREISARARAKERVDSRTQRWIESKERRRKRFLGEAN